MIFVVICTKASRKVVFIVPYAGQWGDRPIFQALFSCVSHRLHFLAPFPIRKFDWLAYARRTSFTSTYKQAGGGASLNTAHMNC